MISAEEKRLQEDFRREKNWKRWGPYLSERQWSTVREDYSEDGRCWDFFPHDHARSRAYRWGEDGLLGITDRECRLCFSLALWNGRDPILKERLFGVTGEEGNHGEDVKELYYYLDSTPTHSYMKALYKYPQNAYPYEDLLQRSAERGLDDPEYELLDTGIFQESRYFDVYAEYAKESPNHILIRITVANRGPDRAVLHLLPTLWFRNTWIWGCRHEGCSLKPRMRVSSAGTIEAEHETLGKFHFLYSTLKNEAYPNLLFTENHTNNERFWGQPNVTPFVKDAFHRYLIEGEEEAINGEKIGTKASPLYVLSLDEGESKEICLQLHAPGESNPVSFGTEFNRIFDFRKREADQFYELDGCHKIKEDELNVRRQAYAGLLWSKQFYHYVVDDWLKGDPNMIKPPEVRREGRNKEWKHLFSRDIISMPDKWEYPWFAAWDSAFHMIPMAKIDPDFAKRQLTLFLREWYMHPNGQIPAYEFAFGDVNPPVHAWAAWRVYKISAKKRERDREFLEGVFQKLLLNFTWWVNRKDADGNNLFAGGFLGLDNIGVFDRGKPLPGGGVLDQADGTAWMAFYANTMLSIALELAWDNGKVNAAYEDMASKFFEHFIQICDAMNTLGGSGLWDDADGFYYDSVRSSQKITPLRIRSLVGLIPLIAVEVIDSALIEKLPGFRRRYEWFLENRPDLAKHISYCDRSEASIDNRMLLALPSKDRLLKVLRYLLHEEEFLSDFGIRGVSKYHKENPYIFEAGGESHRVDYVPGESTTHLFGGNSNWRGPIWFPLNYLIVEALEKYHEYYGDRLKVEFPVDSGHMATLREVSREIARRLMAIFLKDGEGRRPCHGEDTLYQTDSFFKDLVLFYEYFHGDNGRGVGASHQTGWTSLIVRHLEDSYTEE